MGIMSFGPVLSRLRVPARGGVFGPPPSPSLSGDNSLPRDPASVSRLTTIEGAGGAAASGYLRSWGAAFVAGEADRLDVRE